MKLKHLTILLLIALFSACSETTEQKTATTETPAGTMEAESLSDQERAAKRQKDAERIKYVVENVGGFGYGTIKPLIDKGIDVNATVHLVHRNPLPLLSLAITKEDVRLAEHLISLPECDINAEAGGTTPLYIAKLLGMKYLEDLLLEKGARLPASLNDEAALKYIRGQCADPMANSDFVQAIEKRDFIEIERLILKGRDSNFRVQTRAGDTISLLSLALIHEANYLATTILDSPETDFNCESAGLTPLYIAQLLGNTEMENKLKSMGAKLPENPDKATAMKKIQDINQDALTKERREIRGLLEAYNGPDRKKDDYWKKISQLLDSGYDANIKVPCDNNKPTPLLLYALAAEQKDVARQIIETEGCDVNAPAPDGTTALMLAEFLGMNDIVKLLKERETQNPASEQPLYVASKDDFQNYTFKILTKWKSDSRLYASPKISSLRKMRHRERYEVGNPENNAFTYANINHNEYKTLTIPMGYKPILEYGNLLFLVVDFGHMSSTAVFAVWEKTPDKGYQFLANLDTGIFASYGLVIIKQVRHINRDNMLIIGETHGADEGITWGSSWSGVWQKPSSLRLLNEIKYSNNYDSKVYKEEKYRYAFDRTSWILTIKQRESHTTSEKLKTAKHKLDFRKLFKENHLTISLLDDIATPEPYIDNSNIVIPREKVPDIYAEVATEDLAESQILVSTKFISFDLAKDRDRISRDYYQNLEKYILGPGKYLTHLVASAEPVDFENQTIIPLSSINAEGGELVFSLWQQDSEGRLKLETLLDHGVRLSFGKPELKEIIRLDENRKLMLGVSRGSEKFDKWGNFWVGLWEGNSSFRIIKEFDAYVRFNEGLNEGMWEDFDFEHNFNTESMKLEIRQHRLQFHDFRGTIHKKILQTEDYELDLNEYIAKKEH